MLGDPVEISSPSGGINRIALIRPFLSGGNILRSPGTHASSSRNWGALFRGSGELPKAVTYLGKVLPMAVMATLVVYCLRSTSFQSAALFAPQLIAVAVVAALHVWRRNVLLSMFGGTAVYMFLVQTIF